MSSKAEQKRELILKTALQYLQENDLNSLTLDAIAQRASISKGGLLYHFNTKEALRTAVSESIMAEFIQTFEALAKEESGKGRLTRAFILASEKDLAEGASVNIAIQIINNEHSDISFAYDQLLERLLDDGLESTIIHLIRLTIDGLYYSKLLNIAPVSDSTMHSIFKQLLEMTKGE